MRLIKHKSPGLQHFRLIMHKNPGFCDILYEKNLDFTACLGSFCTKLLEFTAFQVQYPPKSPVLVFCLLNMDSLEVAASVGSDAQDLVHDSRGPLSPLLSLASVYIFRPRFMIQALFLGFWN